MATTKEVLARARKEVGTTESPAGSNRTKYGRSYGMDGYAWCAMFIWWLLTTMKVEIIKSAYTPTMADWFKQKGAGFTDDSKARPGDIIFFDFPDSTRRIQHVGIVVSNEGGQLVTIEGNTSSGTSGSQDNGGGVYQRTRGYGEAVYYGRPDYDNRERLPRFDVPKSKTWFGKGDSGADVKNWQRDLNGWMRDLREKKGDKLGFDFGRIDVDGSFGKETLRATKTFQAFYELDADGRVGAHTSDKMERVRERQKAA